MVRKKMIKKSLP